MNQINSKELSHPGQLDREAGASDSDRANSQEQNQEQNQGQNHQDQKFQVKKLDGGERNMALAAFTPGFRFALNGVVFMVMKHTKKDLICRPIARVTG